LEPLTWTNGSTFSRNPNKTQFIAECAENAETMNGWHASYELSWVSDDHDTSGHYVNDEEEMNFSATSAISAVKPGSSSERSGKRTQ
jgi:hypothetical protein